MVSVPLPKGAVGGTPGRPLFETPEGRFYGEGTPNYYGYQGHVIQTPTSTYVMTSEGQLLRARENAPAGWAGSTPTPMDAVAGAGTATPLPPQAYYTPAPIPGGIGLPTGEQVPVGYTEEEYRANVPVRGETILFQGRPLGIREAQLIGVQQQQVIQEQQQREQLVMPLGTPSSKLLTVGGLELAVSKYAKAAGLTEPARNLTPSERYLQDWFATHPGVTYEPGTSAAAKEQARLNAVLLPVTRGFTKEAQAAIGVTAFAAIKPVEYRKQVEAQKVAIGFEKIRLAQGKYTPEEAVSMAQPGKWKIQEDTSIAGQLERARGQKELELESGFGKTPSIGGFGKYLKGQAELFGLGLAGMGVGVVGVGHTAISGKPLEAGGMVIEGVKQSAARLRNPATAPAELALWFVPAKVGKIAKTAIEIRTGPLSPRLMPELPIRAKIENIEFPKIELKGESVQPLLRGVSVRVGQKTAGLGVTAEGPFIGVPKIKLLEEAIVQSHIPSSLFETRVFEKSLEGIAKQRFGAVVEGVEAARTVTPLLAEKTLSTKGTKFLTPEELRIVYDFTKARGGTIKGSIAFTEQAPGVFYPEELGVGQRAIRIGKDVDISFPKQEKLGPLVEQLNQRGGLFKAVGEKVFKKMPGGRIEMVIETAGPKSPPEEQMGMPPASEMERLGIKLHQTPFVKQGVGFTPQAELLLRKGSTAVGIYSKTGLKIAIEEEGAQPAFIRATKGVNLGPAPFRLKDIYDYPVQAQVAAESLIAGGKLREAGTVLSSLEKYKASFPKGFFGVMPKQGELTISYAKPRVSVWGETLKSAVPQLVSGGSYARPKKSSVAGGRVSFSSFYSARPSSIMPSRFSSAVSPVSRGPSVSPIQSLGSRYTTSFSSRPSRPSVPSSAPSISPSYAPSPSARPSIRPSFQPAYSPGYKPSYAPGAVRPYYFFGFGEGGGGGGGGGGGLPGEMPWFEKFAKHKRIPGKKFKTEIKPLLDIGSATRYFVRTGKQALAPPVTRKYQKAFVENIERLGQVFFPKIKLKKGGWQK